MGLGGLFARWDWGFEGLGERGVGKWEEFCALGGGGDFRDGVEVWVGKFRQERIEIMPIYTRDYTEGIRNSMGA